MLCFSFGPLLEGDEMHALTAVYGENEFGPGCINGIGKRLLPSEEVILLCRLTKRCIVGLPID